VVEDEDGGVGFRQEVLEDRYLAFAVYVEEDDEVVFFVVQGLDVDVFFEDGRFFVEEEVVPFGDIGEEEGIGFFTEGGEGLCHSLYGAAGVAVGACVGRDQGVF